MLTQEEVEALPEGTPITVIWSGGNGPANYTVTHSPMGVVCARHQSDPPDYYDFVGRRLTFVGSERWHTRVWLR